MKRQLPAMINSFYLAFVVCHWIGPTGARIFRLYTGKATSGAVKQSIEINDSRVCVFMFSRRDYPLLMIAADIDPLFVMLNEVFASFVNCNLVDAGHSHADFLEVERLMTWYHFILRSVRR